MEEAQEEAQEEDQVGAQAEAQAETMTEDHLMEDHPAEDHPAEGHQENLLETPQKEMNRGETTLGTTMNLTMRIRITIQRTTRTEAIHLHQGEVQPPQATIGTRTNVPKKAVTSGHPTSDRQNTHTTLPTRSNDRARLSGPEILTKQKVPLAEITCHVCGKKGHYRGSKECPKTLTSVHIHTLGIEPDQVEPETPEEPEEEVENPFEGKEFDGEADVEIATSDFDNDGIGAIVVGFHTVSEDVKRNPIQKSPI